MWLLASLPFLLQAILIGIDEVYFHLQRGLPTWEKIGHPLDTLSLLLCFCIILWMPFDPFSLKIYIGCAIFSCLMVTKDEFVHKHHCPASENWLHACLFILHPVTLFIAGCMWPQVHGQECASWITFLLDNPQALQRFFIVQTICMSLFFFYQVIYWNFLCKNRPAIKQ